MKSFWTETRVSEKAHHPVPYGYCSLNSECYRGNNSKFNKIFEREYKIKNLCLAGGVALNCVAGKILKEKIFESIWVQPAAGDAGGSRCSFSLLVFRNEKERKILKPDGMKGSYLGPEIKQNEVEELKEIGANFKILKESELMDFTTGV